MGMSQFETLTDDLRVDIICLVMRRIVPTSGTKLGPAEVLCSFFTPYRVRSFVTPATSTSDVASQVRLKNVWLVEDWASTFVNHIDLHRGRVFSTLEPPAVVVNTAKHGCASGS